MKKTYMQPEIWVEELKAESQVLADSPLNQVTNVTGNTNIIYCGGGSGPARAGVYHLWDDEEDDTDWDQL